MANAVKVTLGPRGRNVILDKKIRVAYDYEGRRHSGQGNRAEGCGRKHGRPDGHPIASSPARRQWILGVACRARERKISRGFNLSCGFYDGAPDVPTKRNQATVKRSGYDRLPRRREGFTSAVLWLKGGQPFSIGRKKVRGLRFAWTANMSANPGAGSLAASKRKPRRKTARHVEEPDIASSLRWDPRD